MTQQIKNKIKRHKDNYNLITEKGHVLNSLSNMIPTTGVESRKVCLKAKKKKLEEYFPDYLE
jgi:hypothetical protein